jgi:glycerol uptake facilitator-like aquaporin
VILSSTKHASSLAALAIPLTLVAIHLVAVPFTGSVNTARSIGPAPLGGDLSSLWITRGADPRASWPPSSIGR